MDVYKETIVKRALTVKERKVVSREKILEEKRTADPIADPSFSMDDEVAEPEIEDEPLEDRDMSTILKYISIYSDGTGYFQNDEFEDDAPFKIAITEESLSEGKALYFYDNFKVNQVDVVAFMKNRKVYNNCLHNLTKDVLLTELIVINSEQLIGVLQKINHIWHIKFIKTSLLKQNNTNLRANGFTIGCNDIDNIQEYITKLIPFELIDSLSGALIPDGLRTKGVQLNGSTFSEYIDDVLPFWPELKKMM